MTDHMGTTLLLQTLLKHPNQSPQGLQEISTLTLAWPHVHCPSKVSWKLWTTTVCNLFTGSASGSQLHYPLGAWTSNYQKYRWWNWRIAPTGWLLHQSTTMLNPHAAIPVCMQRTQITFPPTIPANQLFNRSPVTPFDTYHQVVKLPVSATPQCVELIPTIRLHQSLIAQFHTTLAGWQQPLFGPIKQFQPTAHIWDISKAQLPLILVSDTSVQKSSFAWILTKDTTTLWKGIGLAPSPAEDIYSSWAKAFGVLAGLLSSNTILLVTTPHNSQILL